MAARRARAEERQRDGVMEVLFAKRRGMLWPAPKGPVGGSVKQPRWVKGIGSGAAVVEVVRMVVVGLDDRGGVGTVSGSVGDKGLMGDGVEMLLRDSEVDVGGCLLDDGTEDGDVEDELDAGVMLYICSRTEPPQY